MADATDDIPELDRNGLRRFALQTGGLTAGLFGVFFPWILQRPWPVWPWIVLLVLASWAFLLPLTLRPIYRGWMRFGLLLSKVTSPLIMSVIFFVLVTPIALVRRVRGANLMRTPFEPVTTYRLKSERQTGETLKRPY